MTAFGYGNGDDIDEGDDDDDDDDDGDGDGDGDGGAGDGTGDGEDNDGHRHHHYQQQNVIQKSIDSCSHRINEIEPKLLNRPISNINWKQYCFAVCLTQLLLIII